MGFIDFIKNMTKNVESTTFDASVFENPLALKTSWSPKARGGANFKTRTLKQVSNLELRYDGSVTGKIFAGVFLAFPIIFIVIGTTTFLSEGFKTDGLFFLIIPLVFIGVGIYLMKHMSTPVTIDKALGYCYKGKKVQQSQRLNITKEHTIALEKIKALQIIPERVRGKNSNYTSYEINFIFEDGKRHNLIDHGDRNSIETDAVTISDFLGIPTWNRTSGTSYLPKVSTKETGYDSLNRYDHPNAYETPVTTSSSAENLDEPYDSTKRREF